MKILLDTHTLIWFINGDNKLPQKLITLISDKNNEIYVSVVSLWEIVVKISLGKLSMNEDFEIIENFIKENSIKLLPIDLPHLQKLLNLEFHHKDPFDRLLIAQAISEDLTIITKDKAFSEYNTNILWES